MKLPSPTEPVSELRRVPILEIGEPLVDFVEAGLELDRPRFNYRRETRVRERVCAMLVRADEHLRRRGYQLKVIEGWRPPYIQRRMYQWSYNRFKQRNPDFSHLQLTRLTNRFTAPMGTRVPPPHTTGGAVDVALYRDGSVVDLMSPYELTDHRGFGTLAQLSDDARRHRDLLAEAFGQTEITNYPSEYWHWSFGDQGWAYRGGHPHAIYGPVEPANWTPSDEDDSEQMLVHVDYGTMAADS